MNGARARGPGGRSGGTQGWSMRSRGRGLPATTVSGSRCRSLREIVRTKRCLADRHGAGDVRQSVTEIRRARL